MAQTVDERRQVAFENHRKVAAHGVHLADAEQLGAIAVHGQHLAIRRNGSDAFFRAAQVVGAAVKADEDVARVHRFEQAPFDDGRRHPDQAQGVALIAAVVAGNVEDADQPAVRPENRAGAAGQKAVVLKKMLAAQDGDWGFFGQCGADGVGAALVFVPRGAGRQGNTVVPVNEVGIADGLASARITMLPDSRICS